MYSTGRYLEPELGSAQPQLDQRNPLIGIYWYFKKFGQDSENLLT